MKSLTVGAVAKRAGVNLQTLHYYERRGLLPPARRSDGNYRLYDEDGIRRVRFIKRAQGLGFTLEEIKELLSLRAEPREKCNEVRVRAEAKLADVEERIRSLGAIREALGSLIDECTERRPASECPILSALDSDDFESKEQS